MTEQNIFQLP